MSNPRTKACFVKYPSTGGGARKDAQSAVASKKVWPISGNTVAQDGKRSLSVSFKDGTTDQKTAVKNTLKKSATLPDSLKKTGKTHTWADFANVEFVYDGLAANVYVSFERDGSSWSYVGTDATGAIGQATPSMNLGWLSENQADPTSTDRATILHEFGHALGFMHEHQSPARGGIITLNEQACYRYYLPKLGGNRQKVKSQVIDTYNSSDIAAFSNLDVESIMMYPMTADLNEQGINVGFNDKLSILDQAFATLMYPPDLTKPENIPRFMEAMEIAGIAESEAGIILGAFKKSDGSQYKTGDDIRPGLAAVREAFVKQNEKAMARFRINANFLHQIDFNNPQSGIGGFFRDLAKNKILRNVVKNVAKEVFQQNGIDIIEPQVSETNTMHAIGRLVTHPDIHQAVSNAFFDLLGDSTSQAFLKAKEEGGTLEQGQDAYDEHLFNPASGINPWELTFTANPRLTEAPEFIKKVFYNLIRQLDFDSITDATKTRQLAETHRNEVEKTWGLTIPPGLRGGSESKGWCRIDLQGPGTGADAGRANIQGQWNGVSVCHLLVQIQKKFGRRVIRHALVKSVDTTQTARLTMV